MLNQVLVRFGDSDEVTQRVTAGIPAEAEQALTKDAAFPRRMGKPHEFALLAIAIYENPMLNGSTIRVDGGQRFAPK